MVQEKAIYLGNVISIVEKLMTSAIPKSIMLIGLPSTGKTSFLAALWYMVNQNKVKCALQLDKLEGETRYLNMIRQAWLRYEPVPRNTSDSEVTVRMILQHKSTHSTLELSVPDLSGESFSLQWATRQCTLQYDMVLRKAKGGILFVHPSNIVKPIRIDTVMALADSLGGGMSEGDQENSPSQQAASAAWEIAKAPTQVQLVELLQFVCGREHFQPPFRLAVVVSAWDIVEHLGKDPKNWISAELPMLMQFIESNDAILDAAFYGISAQGVDYVNPGVAELKKKSPDRRVKLAGDGINNRFDITEPLQWLLH